MLDALTEATASERRPPKQAEMCIVPVRMLWQWSEDRQWDIALLSIKLIYLFFCVTIDHHQRSTNVCLPEAGTFHIEDCWHEIFWSDGPGNSQEYI
jgi:hypothetical protein